MTDLDHPCKQTCSGWEQGYEAGMKAARPDTETVSEEKCTHGTYKDEYVERLRWQNAQMLTRLHAIFRLKVRPADALRSLDVTEKKPTR